MNKCCKGQTTPHCPTCGANLKGNTLVGLKEYLEKRLRDAKETLTGWQDSDDLGQKKVQQGIARSTTTVERLESWIRELDKNIRPLGTPATPTIPPLGSRGA